MKAKGDIHDVIRPLGIKLYDGARFLPQGRAKACFCRRTLRKILNEHGEGHLKLVLSLISESENNCTELYSETISAVSGLVAAFPDEINSMRNLHEWFDDLDLHEMRYKARSYRTKPIHIVLQTMLIEYFELPLFGDPN